jgi:hypothetical protein
MVDHGIHNVVFFSFALLASVASSIASLLLITIITRLRARNFYVTLIFAMAWFEFLHDIFFFFCIVGTGTFGLTIAANIALLTGATSSSMLSNVIAGIAFYVIYTKKSVHIIEYCPIIIAACVIPSFVTVVLYLAAMCLSAQKYLATVWVLYLHCGFRVLSIAINFCCSSATTYLTYQMSSFKGSPKSPSEIAIMIMPVRLLYYPIVQAVGSGGSVWYELQYGFNFNRNAGFDYNPPNVSNTQFSAQCVMLVCAPVVSIGYLVIFIIMQPEGSRILKHLFSSGNEATNSTQPSSVNNNHDIPNCNLLEDFATAYTVDSDISDIAEGSCPSETSIGDLETSLMQSCEESEDTMMEMGSQKEPSFSHGEFNQSAATKKDSFKYSLFEFNQSARTASMSI